MIEIQNFGMNNSASPIMAQDGLVRLALNGELVADGRFRKRLGITTAVTVSLQVGIAAPYSLVPWRIGATTYLVAVGADAIAEVHPFNNYLYWRTAADAKIYSDTTPTVVSAAWGATAPTSSAYLNRATGASSFGAGGYAYKVTSWLAARFLESAPLEVTANVLSVPTKLLFFGGAGQYGVIPAITLPSGTTARWYRGQITTFSESWAEQPAGQSLHLRMIEEKANGNTWNDYAGQLPSRLLDYAYTTVPQCLISQYFDGRWFYVSTTAPFKVYYSNPACPETYAGTDYSVLSEQREGMIQGKGELAIQDDCGAPIGTCVLGQTMLVLCERGAWRIVPQETPGLYAVLQDRVWVGCVSRASIAYGREGVWWLAPDGVALWTGEGAPQVVTRRVIDPEDSDTLFASDLSTASAAYDPDKQQYHVVVPKSGGGQFALVIRGDRLRDGDFAAVWTFGAKLGTIAGMGYDPANRRVVYLFEAEDVVTAKCATASTYRDYDATTGDTYAFTIEAWWTEVSRQQDETKKLAAARLFVHRDNVSVQQTVSVVVDGVLGTVDPTASTALTLTWAVNETGPVVMGAQERLGRSVKATFTNTDAYPFEFRALQVGPQAALDNRQGVR